MITFIYILSVCIAIFQLALMCKLWKACDNISDIKNKIIPLEKKETVSNETQDSTDGYNLLILLGVIMAGLIGMIFLCQL